MSDMLPTEPEQRTLTVGVCISFYYAISKPVSFWAVACIRLD